MTEDLSRWNTSSGTTFFAAFKDATAFNAPLSHWDVSKAYNLKFMFEGAASLSECNQARLHARFSANRNWPYGTWAELPPCPLPPPPSPSPPSPPPPGPLPPPPPCRSETTSYTYDTCDDGGEGGRGSPPSPPPSASQPCLHRTEPSALPRPPAGASCDAPTVGLLRRTAPEGGYMLYSPRVTTDVYLVSIDTGEVAHRWRTPYGTGHGVYLTRDGDLVRLEDDGSAGGYATNATISIPGDASLISVYDWDGRLLWRRVLNNATHRVHHQIDPHDFDVRKGTGTLFALTAYRMGCAEARALGRRVCDEADGMYVEAVLEIDTSGEVVWEWYLSNHLCSAHCSGHSTVDVNSGVGAAKADWVHANSLVYDAINDVLLMGGAYTSEVYVIDHAAPSEASPRLPPSSSSSSLLHRIGADRFGEQHDVRVVACADDALCFTVFNNGRYRAAGAACSFGANGTQTSECGSEALLVSLPRATIAAQRRRQGPVRDDDDGDTDDLTEEVGPAAGPPTVTILFDAATVPSLLGEGEGPFLRICDHAAGACLEQSRFFSLILSSAQVTRGPNPKPQREAPHPHPSPSPLTPTLALSTT